MKNYILSLIFLTPSILFANFSEKPEEISSFETLFNNLILSKRADLPPGFFTRSKLVKNDSFERIYTVENEGCSNNLFLGELFRAEVQNVVQELVVYSCQQGEDGVNFFRMGPNLKPFDSTSLLHLDFQSLLSQGLLDLQIGEGFFLEVKSFQLEFLFQKNNHYQRTLTINKDTPDKKVKLVFIQSTYEQELRWEIDIFETSKNEVFTNEESVPAGPLPSTSKQVQFLTISRKNPFHEGIFSHERYYNGFKITPLDYLSLFMQVESLLEEFNKRNSVININLPTAN